MIKMKNWLIYREDGSYLGQSAAFAAKVAFCQYMSLYGKPVSEGEIVLNKVDENSQHISYGSEQFTVLSPDIHPHRNP